MRKSLLLLLLVSGIFTVKAGQKSRLTAMPVQSQTIQQAPAPEPPGGMAAFKKYMRKIANRDYNNADTGTVTVSFIVEKDGTLSGYKIVHPFNTEANGLAIQMLKENDQKWKPAMQNGQPVSAPYTLAVPYGQK